MKNFIFFIIGFVACHFTNAQQPPILPKHEIARPTPQLKIFPPLTQYIYEGSWGK